MTAAALAPHLSPPVPPRAAASALALKEIRLLFGMSTFYLGFFMSVALCTVWGWTTEPRWDVFAANSGMAALVFAGFLLLIGHLAASRDHRHAVTEFGTALPSPAPRRTVALLAIVPAAGVAGAMAVGVELLALAPTWPAGAFDPWLVAVPVVVPMLGAAIGVTVGRWLPSTAAGPLTLFGAAAVLAVLPVLGSGAGDLPWLLFPVVLDESVAPGVPRPTGWHLAYLAAVLIAVIGAAVLRHWTAIGAVVVLLALVTAVTAVHRQQTERLPIDPATAMPYLGESAQRCEQHGAVTYCALQGYSRWVPLWREAIDPIVAALPPAAGPLPVVRQGIGPASAVVVDQHWGRHGAWKRKSTSSLSVEYVRVLLKMPDQLAGDPGPLATPERNRAVLPQGTMSLSRGPMCSGAGQLRTVVALWLLGQSGPEGRALLNEDELPEFGRVTFGQAEVDAARRLLDVPTDHVTALLADTWTTVRSPAPVGEVLTPLGVTVAGTPSGETPCP